MQLPPPSARPQAVLLIKPFALAIHLQSGAIDQKMQRLVAPGQRWQDCHAATTAAQGCMIRNGDIDLEHLSDRSQHTFGLTKWLVKHQPKRETRFDRKRRIDWLTTALSGGRCVPCCHCFLGKPYREVSPPHQRGIVFRPVRHSISGLRYLMAAASVEFVRHRSSNTTDRHRLAYDRAATMAPSWRASAVRR